MADALREYEIDLPKSRKGLVKKNDSVIEKIEKYMRPGTYHDTMVFNINYFDMTLLK